MVLFTKKQNIKLGNYYRRIYNKQNKRLYYPYENQWEVLHIGYKEQSVISKRMLVINNGSECT